MRRRYRGLLEDHATLNADYLATNWRVLERGAVTVQPDGYDVADVQEVEVIHEREADALRFVYAGHDGDAGKRTLRSATVRLTRDPCHYGGERQLFVAPCCGRRRRVLALLPAGVSCRACARLTYRSRRKSGVPRTIDRADKLAGRLGLENWWGPVKERPLGMRRETFDKLAEEHGRLVRQAMAKIQPRLARAARRGQAAYWGAMLRAGL
jgi:hypothetical protein